jgi:arginyl-tRNA synthetase
VVQKIWRFHTRLSKSRKQRSKNGCKSVSLHLRSIAAEMRSAYEARMNLLAGLEDVLRGALGQLCAEGVLPAGMNMSGVAIKPSPENAGADLSVNAALVLAGQAGMPPRELARLIAEKFRENNDVEKAESAGPGFVNLTLKPEIWPAVLRAALAQGNDFGRCNIGAGEPVNIGYVSANSIGPVQAGQIRGAVLGDSLARLLSFAGYETTCEYYIQDAGEKADALARSAFMRYREALGEEIGEIPGAPSPGEYLKPVGEALAKEYGGRLLDAKEQEWLPIARSMAVPMMMDLIRDDLAALGNREVVISGRTLGEAEEAGPFGRAILVVDADGEDHAVNLPVLLRASHRGPDGVDVKRCPTVRFLKGAQPYEPPERKGCNTVARKLVDEIGVGTVRFTMLSHRMDGQFHFDVEEAAGQSNRNPVFCVQYAHARACSALSTAKDVYPERNLEPSELAGAKLSLLTGEAELAIIKKIAGFPRVIEDAALAREPRMAASFAHDLAVLFHSLWARGKELPQLRFMVEGHWDLTEARLALVSAVAQILRSCLRLLGVEAISEMR